MQTVETILGNKPPIRKAILLEYAKTPNGIAVKHIDEKLGVSGLDKNHLKKLEELGILETCPIEVCRPAGRFKTMTACMDKGYRLKQDNDTFAELLSIFVGTEHLEDFLHSSYVQNVLNISGLEIHRVIMDLITACMKTVLLTLNMFYPNMELPDQMSATFMIVDVSDDTAYEHFIQKKQEAAVLMRTTMDKLKQLLPMLSDLPNLYEKAISPDIRSDS